MITGFAICAKRPGNRIAGIGPSTRTKAPCEPIAADGNHLSQSAGAITTLALIKHEKRRRKHTGPQRGNSTENITMRIDTNSPLLTQFERDQLATIEARLKQEY